MTLESLRLMESFVGGKRVGVAELLRATEEAIRYIRGLESEVERLKAASKAASPADAGEGRE
jgi:molybdenum-dependent DNA-binding transcriptional regulator ModE